MSKLFIFVIVFLLVQTVLYLGVEIFEGEPHDVERAIDKRIPVVPAFTFIYVSWYLLIFIMPFLLYYADFGTFLIYMGAMTAIILISTIAYLVYPTSFKRPDSGSQKLKFLYFISYKQLNCAPSMHCSMSFVAVVAACLCPGLSPVVRVLVIADGLMIPVSTLFTKQHVVIDVLTALPLAAAGWAAGWGLYVSGLAEKCLGFLR